MKSENNNLKDESLNDEANTSTSSHTNLKTKIKHPDKVFKKSHFDTVVVGAGQAGIAMSEHLSTLSIDHVIFEKDRIAEAWRTRRWDSLVANGPSWHDKFPNMQFDAHQDAFISHDKVADYFEDYSQKINAPIYTGVEVIKAKRTPKKSGFTIETSKGEVTAQRIIVATGAFQTAVIPSIAPKDDSLYQIHSNDYRNPQQLPEGATLVIGSGSSGVQIADELNRAGKKVYLSVGPHERPPRRYRGRDNVWWLGVLGGWDVAQSSNQPLKGLAVSGADGGKNIDFKELSQQGITLLGMTDAFEDTKVTFKDDLAKNILEGEALYLKFLDEADAFIERNELELPEDPEARNLLPDPDCLKNPILSLDLVEENITSVIWASGFGYDYSWLEADTFDDSGKPLHKQGISEEKGVYFLGLPYLTGRGSSFIWGVWHDAKRIADHINIQRQYLEYNGKAERLTT